MIILPRFNFFLNEKVLADPLRVIFRRFLLNHHECQDVELSASSFKNLHIPRVTGTYKTDKHLEKVDESFKGSLEYLKKKLDLPHKDFAVILCKENRSLLQLVSSRKEFLKKLRFFYKLGLTNDQLLEAPGIFSEPIVTVAKTSESWRAHGFDSPHPLLLIADDVNPLLNCKRGMGKGKDVGRAYDAKLLLAQTIAPHRTNAAFLADMLETTVEEVYEKARHHFPILVKGHLHTDRISEFKRQGLDPTIMFKYYEEFTACNLSRLRNRVKLLLEMQPFLPADGDLLDSHRLFGNEVSFSMYYVGHLRNIYHEEFPSHVKDKVSLISHLLNIPEDLVYDFMEVHPLIAADTFKISNQKISSLFYFLLESGFSGPEILRNLNIANWSLYNIGHAIDHVMRRFDLEEISDAYLEDVVRVTKSGIVVQEYNLLSNFVYVNLASLLDTYPSAVKKGCNLWTRGRLKNFLKLTKERMETEDGDGEAEVAPKEELDQSRSKEVANSEKKKKKTAKVADIKERVAEEVVSPWQTLVNNVTYLHSRWGFDKEAILQCLFVVANSEAALKAAVESTLDCDPHAVREMTVDEQSVFLNLVAYEIHRKEKKTE